MCVRSFFFDSVLLRHVPLADRAQDAHGIDALVHMQADRVHFKAGALGFAGPPQIRSAHAAQFFQSMAHGGRVVTCQGVFYQLLGPGAGGVELQGRVQVRVVGPRCFGLLGVAGLIHQAHFGVVFAPVGVAVGQHLGLARGGGLRGGFGFGGFPGFVCSLGCGCGQHV